MVNTSIVRLFYILDAAEKRRIRKKLEAQDKSEDLLALFNYLYKNIKKPKKLDKEVVFASVYSKLKKFDNNKLTQLRYRLYRFIEDEIVVSQIMGISENSKTEHLIQKEMILLDYFRDKVILDDKSSVERISKLVEMKVNDVSEMIEEAKIKDMEYYLNVHRFSHHLYYNLDAEIRGERKMKLEDAVKNLDTYYCLAKLRYSFEMKTRNREFNEEMSISFFEEMYNFSNTLSKKTMPLIELYRLFVDIEMDMNKSKIIELKNMIFSIKDELGKRELVHALNILLNLMIYIDRKKNVDMDAEKHEVYHFIFKNNLLINNGVVSPKMLINYVVNCLHTNNHQEILAITKFHENYLPATHKLKILALCNAYYKFGEGDCYEAYILIINNPYRHCFILQKILLLKTIYELENSGKKMLKTTLHDAIYNFRRFLRREYENNKIGENSYDAIFDFTKFLLILTDPNTKKDVLVNTFTKYPNPLPEKKWLRSKINEK